MPSSGIVAITIEYTQPNAIIFTVDVNVILFVYSALRIEYHRSIVNRHSANTDSWDENTVRKPPILHPTPGVKHLRQRCMIRINDPTNKENAQSSPGSD